MPEEEESSLEGWEPVVGQDVSLDRLVDLAFDYRGDVTLAKADGSELVGYLFNRERNVPEPFVQMFDRAGNGPFMVKYAEIRAIRFTGKDTAAGQSYEAYQKRKAQGKAAPEAGDTLP